MADGSAEGNKYCDGKLVACGRFVNGRLSGLGNQSFIFPAFSLVAGALVKVGDSASNSGIDFHWLDGSGTWNNSESDPAELYDSAGQLINTLDN